MEVDVALVAVIAVWSAALAAVGSLGDDEADDVLGTAKAIMTFESLGAAENWFGSERGGRMETM